MLGPQGLGVLEEECNLEEEDKINQRSGELGKKTSCRPLNDTRKQSKSNLLTSELKTWWGKQRNIKRSTPMMKQPEYCQKIGTKNK